MNETFDADVLIVGAGPVGMTIAMDLNRRGIGCIVVERRAFLELPSVKCNHVSARSMESFRRLGVAGLLRGAGLPVDYEHSVAFRTTVTGTELSRVFIPSRGERFTDTSGPDGNWPTPEPPHRINQTYLEPLLQQHVATLPHVQLLNRTEVTGYAQDEEGVTTTATDDAGTSRTYRTRYIIGCEGGRSLVRKSMGAQLQGTAVIHHVQSTCIRAPQLLDMIPHRTAWGVYAINPRRSGTVYAIDGRETWLVHNHLQPQEEEGAGVDRDRCIRDILGVGPDFQYEVVSKEDWVARRLVSDRFRDRRAFIAGDAAHLWVPYAGYGMNAGIADGLNLSWHLAARLRGWADEGVLAAYERERMPITAQVSHFAMNHALALTSMRAAVPPDIEAPGPQGDAVREEIGRKAYELNVQQFCCAGLNFGYFYDASPVIAYDGQQAPAYSMGGFIPSTVPGCRAPHLWLSDGRSLYDAFGDDYTLLQCRGSLDPSALLDAARSRKVPMVLLDLRPETLPPAYEHDFVLCRPDQHVAWRGNALPGDPLALVDRLRGAA
ncbi:FAD-dependent oxidoreductase [Ramlibacter rhizophilus]|uniref:Monooxygenase n=1 Tax=Ramlibacter rhizophilus TaxID=1781167 RepID=A0A4Z0BZL7_9BURK|nr:FAD-dependent oxidoreductase [Ramlibacter rhizophilus]TFZ03445.1 monooxygenase [Ramlibacter rhizophilus]